MLRFRSLVDSTAGYVAGIVDTRQLSKVRYTLRDCYLSAVALFYVQDRSLLQFQRRFQRKFQANNLSSTFGVSRIPCDSQLRDLIDRHDYAPMLPCFADWIGRLQRFKWLQNYQVFDARYLITLDGSRYFSSELVSCERCLSTTKDGIERHHHDILQAAIVHPDKRVVLPLAPEFIRNSDGRGGEYHKQDCEINAARGRGVPFGVRQRPVNALSIRALRRLGHRCHRLQASDNGHSVAFCQVPARLYGLVTAPAPRKASCRARRYRDFRRGQRPAASPRPPRGLCRQRSIGSASGLPYPPPRHRSRDSTS